MSASFLEAEIIVSCDLYGICQLGEIITPSFSCALLWSHWFSHHASSCFDSCGRGLVLDSILCTDHKAKRKQQGLNTSFMEDCQGFLSLEIAGSELSFIATTSTRESFGLWIHSSFQHFPSCIYVLQPSQSFEYFIMLQLLLSLSIKASTQWESLHR